MVVKCSTRAEAEELQSQCAVCGLDRFAIKNVFPASGPHFEIEKCQDRACGVHCHGHSDRKVLVDLGDGYREAGSGVIAIS